MGLERMSKETGSMVRQVRRWRGARNPELWNLRCRVVKLRSGSLPGVGADLAADVASQLSTLVLRKNLCSEPLSSHHSPASIITGSLPWNMRRQYA